MCRVCCILCVVRVRLTLFVSRCRSPPPEVVVLGSGSIVAYLGQLLRGQKPCYRLKLMFVGQENVGYTLFRLPPTLLIAHTDRTRTTRTTRHDTHDTQENVAASCAAEDRPKGQGRVQSRQTRGRNQPYACRPVVHDLVTSSDLTSARHLRVATLCSHPHGAVVDGRDRHQRVEPAHGLRMGRRCAGGRALGLGLCR
jgi:hypothetical protein